LRDKPELRRLLARCRHRWIFFIADPRNAGREDLGCPFGCADLHRRRRSTERSVRYNGSANGKLKRYQREEERRQAKERLAAEGPQAPETRPATSLEETSPSVHPSGTLQVQAASSAETTAGRLVSRLSGDCGGSSPRGRHPNAFGDPPVAEPERLQADPGIVAYVQFVISLLEERPVHREEILEMFARTRRQHSFAREKRIDYVLRRLRQEPHKPP
jgi:hypothetical protein